MLRIAIQLKAINHLKKSERSSRLSVHFQFQVITQISI